MLMMNVRFSEILFLTMHLNTIRNDAKIEYFTMSHEN